MADPQRSRRARSPNQGLDDVVQSDSARDSYREQGRRSPVATPDDEDDGHEHQHRDDHRRRAQPGDDLHDTGQPIGAMRDDPRRHARIEESSLVVANDILGESAERPGGEGAERNGEGHPEAARVPRVKAVASPPHLPREPAPYPRDRWSGRHTIAHRLYP